MAKSHSKPIFSKIPAVPVKRLTLVSEFAARWSGDRVTPSRNMPKRVRAASQRLGIPLPKILKSFYESGLHAWFAAHANEQIRWVPIEELQFHERTAALTIMEYGSQSPMFAIPQEAVENPDPPIREYSIQGKYSKPPFKVVMDPSTVPLSEMLIREVLMAASDVVPDKRHRLPLESHGPDAVRNTALREELTQIPINGRKCGTDWRFYESADLLFQESDTHSEYSYFAILAGRSREVIEEFEARTFLPVPENLPVTTFWSAPPSQSASSQGTFPAERLQATGGEISATIYEYANKGYIKQLNWSVTLRFKPFKQAGFSFRCSASVENIPWTMRNWQHLDGRCLAGDSFVPEIHASFYTSDHNPADRYQLQVRHLKRDLFEVLLRMEINFRGYTETDADPRLVVVGRTKARYSGLLLIPGNFKRPTVQSAEQLTKLAESFVELSYYMPPSKEESGYRFAPKF